MEFQRLVELFQEAGYEPRSYSGRGMNGQECLGVVVDNSINMILNVIAAFAEWGYESRDLIDQLTGAHTDGMGQDTVVYWRGIKWEGGAS